MSRNMLGMFLVCLESVKVIIIGDGTSSLLLISLSIKDIVDSATSCGSSASHQKIGISKGPASFIRRKDDTDDLRISSSSSGVVVVRTEDHQERLDKTVIITIIGREETRTSKGTRHQEQEPNENDYYDYDIYKDIVHQTSHHQDLRHFTW